MNKTILKTLIIIFFIILASIFGSIIILLSHYGVVGWITAIIILSLIITIGIIIECSIE